MTPKSWPGVESWVRCLTQTPSGCRSAKVAGRTCTVQPQEDWSLSLTSIDRNNYKLGRTTLQRQEASQAWECTLLIPALKKQKQAVLCEFQASLGYRKSSKPAREHSETLSQTQKQNQGSLIKGLCRLGWLMNMPVRDMGKLRYCTGWYCVST